MVIEELKKEFIREKKKQLKLVEYIVNESRKRKIPESEKLQLHRDLVRYNESTINILNKLKDEVFKVEKVTLENKEEIKKKVIVDFDVDKDYLSIIENEDEREYMLKVMLGIDPKINKCSIRVYDLRCHRRGFYDLHINELLYKQQLIDEPIYFFDGYYDYSEDCYGPCFGEYIYAKYGRLYDSTADIEVLKSKKADFEKDKIIIDVKDHLSLSTGQYIFEQELLNEKNKSVDECIKKTRKRLRELNYKKSPEYKEKLLMKKIDELYQKVKGNFINSEILYSSDFIDIVREIYELPNNRTVKKEKIIKNKGKNSVIIIATTEDNKYLITFQNRIKDRLTAEFPAGYIEENETVEEAALRELKEETGYSANTLHVVDEVYSSPSIDNSITYIAVAKNCKKSSEIKMDGTELVRCGLFNKEELKYMINNHIMCGASNRLAYYMEKYNAYIRRPE